MKLDIGCGNSPRGHVNCDKFIGKSEHTSQIINPKTIPNFVQCSINFLPFKTNGFNEVVSHTVLEHKGVRLIQAIREMVRVSSDKVFFVIPHRFGDSGTKAHSRLFNVSTIYQLLRKMKFSFNIKVEYRCFPHPVICLVRLPYKIHVEIYVHKEKKEK